MHERSPGNPGDVKIVRLCIRFSIFPLEPGERLFMHGTITSEYYQEIPQSQSADNPDTAKGAAQHSRDTRKTN